MRPAWYDNGPLPAVCCFFFKEPATTEIYTLSLHDALPISGSGRSGAGTRDNLVAGRLDLHRDGYGFVRPNARQGTTDDVFIPPDEINGAMQGDQVLVEMAPPRADG